MNKLYNNRGYTLLFASLTAALVLGVAVFILSVSRRQFILSSIARNSMFSIYAADSAMECVALRNADISSSTLTNALNCNGHNVSMVDVTTKLPPDNIPFHKNIFDDSIHQSEGYLWTGDTSCARLTITTGYYRNNLDDTNLTSAHAKIYNSYGYNLCKGDPTTATPPIPDYSSPNIVERALQLTYKAQW